MSRYFIEVRYTGTRFAGFQIQENAVTVQEEMEKAMGIYLRKKVDLTGSSRTDSGVHALQNFFHTDVDNDLPEGCVYNINALLPPEIAVLSVRRMPPGAHCRFDALWRSYSYHIYRSKDPFLKDRGYYYPYAVDATRMGEAAAVLKEYTDFSSFSKRNSQVKSFSCRILESMWSGDGTVIQYKVSANRFLRGMVRGLVGTMLQVGRGRIGVDEFRRIIAAGDQSRVDFSPPGCGLYLERVVYPDGFFDEAK
jgi:tRNA pseudouridine38-40 synthase